MNAQIDPMDLLDQIAGEDLSSVDTSNPILAAGEYEFSIKEVTLEEAESGFKYLLVKLNLMSSGAKDTVGRPVLPGYSMRHMIGLTISDKTIAEIGPDAAKERVKVNIVKFLDALGNRELDKTFQSYPGQTLFAKTRVSKERTDAKTGQVYEPQAEIAMFIPKA